MSKYSKSTYFSANGVSIDRLEEDIRQSAITVALDAISEDPSDVTITFKDVLGASNESILTGTVFPAHTGLPLEDQVEPQAVDVQSSIPFAAKKILVGGEIKSIFKRVHGVSAIIAAGSTVDIDFVVPHPTVKFTGAEVINTHIGDRLDFTVHDNATNTYSGAPVETYGANLQLNQFGFGVYLPDGFYQNTSNYDADLYLGMIIRCSYTNNTGSSKTVYMNPWLHEVK